MRLQSNLTRKETVLADLLGEKDRTILEQQKIIRRLLRKSVEEEERSVTASCYSSDSTLYRLPDYDQGKTDLAGYQRRITLKNFMILPKMMKLSSK